MGGATAGAAAPGGAANPPPAPPRDLTVPPMAMKGLPTIFVPVDESGVAPPLVPLMSKSAQATIGTRPPMMLSSRGGTAAAGKSDTSPAAVPGRVKKNTRARRDMAIFIVVFFLILGGVGGGLVYYLNPWGTTAAVNTVKAKLDAAAELPGQAVNKAQKAMDLAREKEQAKLDAAIKGEDPALNVKPTPAPSSIVNTAQDTNETSGAADHGKVNRVVATPADVVAPEPNPAFVKWSGDLKVTGVYQGNPARALIDGRLVRQGEVIEPIMGVKFAGVDAPRKHIILKDESGAQVRLKY